MHSKKNNIEHKKRIIAEVFYGANYWSPIITSKNSSEILSNHNKHLWLLCFQYKMWIKMPKWTIFLIPSKVFALITENFWRIFWRDKWRSIIGAVENVRLFYTFWTFLHNNFNKINRFYQNGKSFGYR